MGSLKSLAQTQTTVNLSTVPYYQRNFERIDYIDSLQQNDSNFVMTGYYKEPYRSMRIWGPRLYPHGNFTTAGQASVTYYNTFNDSTQNNTSCGNHQQTASWEYIGSNGMPSVIRDHSAAGQLHRIEFDPNYNGTTNRTLYASSMYGGLWRSENGGDHWSVVNTDLQLPQTSVSDIAVSTLNSNHLFIATGNGDANFINYGNSSWYSNPIFTSGVYRSLDYGQTWTPINSGFMNHMADGEVTTRLEINPDNPNKLICATSNGIFTTSNALATNPTWNQVPNASLPHNVTWRGIEYKPGDPSTIYVSGKDIYKTTNGGTSWQSMTGAGTGLDLNNLDFSNIDSNHAYDEFEYGVLRINIDVNPNDTNKLYAYIITEMVNSNNDSQWLEVAFIYQYNGHTWIPLQEALYSIGSGRKYTPSWMGIEANPYDTNVVYYGHTYLKKLDINPTTGVVTNTDASDYTGYGFHADVHDLQFSPAPIDSNRLFCVNHGGMSVKDIRVNGIFGWTYKNNGLQLKLIWTYDHNRIDKHKYALALQDAGFEISEPDTNGQFIWKTHGPGGDGYGVQIADDKNNRVFYINSGDHFYSSVHTSYYSSDLMPAKPGTSPTTSSDRVQNFQVINHPKTDEAYFYI